MNLWPALLLVGLAAPGPRQPAIRDLSIALDGVQVLVSFQLEHALTTDLAERIESGLPSGFVYEISLARDRQWWDEGIASVRLEVVAMYNAVTREFLVNFKQDGELLDSRVLTDRTELERAMTRFSALPLFTLDQASARERYLVRTRVELAPGSLLGFIPMRRTTSWVESNKVRVRAQG